MSAASTKSQLGRLLALAPYLQARGAVPLREVAADFGVTPDQLLKDLRVLYMCGLPGLAPGDYIEINVEALQNDPDGLVRISQADYLARPLRLGSNEATALVVGLRALLESSPGGSREVIERTLSKLEIATEGAAPPLVEVRLPDGALDRAAVREVVDRAISSDRQVRLRYYVPARDESTDRIVDPLVVLRRDGHEYLDGWCHLAGGRRLFRLDRVESVEVAETPRATADHAPRDLSEGLFAPAPDALRVRLLLGPEMAWFAEHYPVEELARRADGWSEATMAVSDERWLMRLVLRFAPALEVLGPDDFAERVRDAARDALRLQTATA